MTKLSLHFISEAENGNACDSNDVTTLTRAKPRCSLCRQPMKGHQNVKDCPKNRHIVHQWNSSQYEQNNLSWVCGIACALVTHITAHVYYDSIVTIHQSNQSSFFLFLGMYMWPAVQHKTCAKFVIITLSYFYIQGLTRVVIKNFQVIILNM